MTVTLAKPLLNLDGTNIAWHADRVEAWERCERIAPVSVDLAWTRACQAACRGCYAVLQEPHERSNVTADDARRLLDDFAEIGVRAFSIVSDGESTLSPAWVPSILHGSDLGLDVGAATNGWRMFPEVSETVLPRLRWVRFTALAATPERFAEMMIGDPGRTDLWDTAIANIRAAVEIKRRRGLNVTLGLQTFLAPTDADVILPYARLGVELGMDYVVLKHFSDDERGSYGIDYAAYPRLFDLLREAEGLSAERTQVIVKWSKIRTGDRPPYRRMWACPFLLQISGSGLVAPSGMFFNARYAKLWIGNYTQERFRDLWRSDRYWDAMNYLASPAFDASRHMGALPIQHYANVALDRHVRGVERITAPPEGTPRPAHWKFV